MNKTTFSACLAALGFCIAAPTFALQPPPVAVDLPGARADGSVLLPNQWSLRPAGRQVDLGDFPVSIAMHPKGRFAAVLHCGHGAHQIIIVDIQSAKVVSKAPVHEAYYGLEFSRDGHALYCSGASDEVVHVFSFDDGNLSPKPDLRIRAKEQRGIPCGIAISPDNRELFTANLWGQSVSRVNLAGQGRASDITFTNSNAASARTFKDSKPVDPEIAAATKRAQAMIDPTSPDAPFPYACQLNAKQHRLYVSLWAQAEIAVVDLNSDSVVALWKTGLHPNEMVLTKSGRHLFVANANANTVSILDTATGRTVETLDAALSPWSLPGSTPNSLALSPDETKLFVANACNNNVAVFDVESIGHSHSLGFIPVGWYPTSVRVTPDGKNLLVANGKGITSRANPRGPQPNKRGTAQTQSIAELFPGTLSIIELPKGRNDWDKQLAPWTAQAFRCAPQHSVPQVAPPSDNPVFPGAGRPGAIEYCIYIIKENRTYDQVLGDMEKGNGDPNLCLFPEKITPNHHKLAREFVLFDNFYVDAEVSADGHEWSMGAYASDFVEKTWPLNYGHNSSKKYPYPSEGIFPIASPANGYLWDRAQQAGVTYRSFGEFVYPGKHRGEVNWTREKALQGHFDPVFRGFDLTYPDAKRADRFIGEMKRFEAEGEMPRLQIVRLPNDHTQGTTIGTLSPTAYLADNDWALGRVVEAVSQTKFWPRTAIFILEDDAQNGPDHVDAHRSPAFVISPYTRRAAVDSTMYSTSSLLHTIELILGLSPMTQFDAAATPMIRAFQNTPDARPYESVRPDVDFNDRNTKLSWGAGASQKMDFSKEDATDETALNEVIWHSVRGAETPMPAPVHAAFVFDRQKQKDDD
jgi:YVTN family beta-propeller protein